VSRDLTAGLEAEVIADSLRPVLLYAGDFTGGTLRLWTGAGTLVWMGENWVGAGDLLGVSEIDESADIRANGVTLSLSGLNPSVISAALGQARQGLPGQVWIGALAADGTLIADPCLIFEGRLDVPEIDDSGDTCTVSISYESRLIDLERPRERRITHEDQQIDYPGDRGRGYVTVLQAAVVVW
jgi:hypothetical protein